MSDAKIVTCNLSKKEVSALDELVNEGYYLSRSDAVRQGVRILLGKKIAG